MTKTIDVLAIGNAIVDYFVKVDEPFLQGFGLEKSSYGLVDEAMSDAFIARLPKTQKVAAGGAAANSIAALATMGCRAAFIGCVKNDPVGIIFRDSMTSVGVHLECEPHNSVPGTGRSIVMITPDASRTMRTYLGASVHVNPELLSEKTIANAKMVMLEGYFFEPNNAFNTNVAAAKMAKAAGGKVVLCASDKFCVEASYSKFAPFIKEYVDIYIANKAEAIATAKTDTVEAAVAYLKDMVPTAVITLGQEGSIVVQDGQEHFVPPPQIDDIVDSTGAGDLYAAGLLYGQVLGLDIVESAKCGSECAGKILQQIGARLSGQISEISLAA